MLAGAASGVRSISKHVAGAPFGLRRLQIGSRSNEQSTSSAGGTTAFWLCKKFAKNDRFALKRAVVEVYRAVAQACMVRTIVPPNCQTIGR